MGMRFAKFARVAGVANVAVAFSALACRAVMSACGGGSNSGGGGGGTKPPNGALVVLPGSPSIPVGESIQFTAYLQNAATTSTWTASTGTIDGTGLFQAPSSPGTVTITATAGSNGGTTSVQVVAAQPISVTPAALTIPAGGIQTFTSPGNTVSWSVNGGVGNCLAPSPGATGACYGVIDGGGNYQAPLAPPPGGSVTITASNGTGSGTASATILFSAASLTSDGSSGQYVIAMNGVDLSKGYPLDFAGTILTSGSATSTTGSVTGGVVDINSLTSGLSTAAQITAGSYTVGAVDGRTTFTFTSSSSSLPTFTLQATLQNSQHALLVDFDSFATGSGTLDAQNTAAFNPLSGNFAFQYSGVDTTAKSVASIYAAGAFLGNGNSIPVNPVNAPTNVQDIVDNALSTPVITNDQTLSGTYSNPDANGRGTITMNSTEVVTAAATTYAVTFAYYIIDQTHLKIVEIDSAQAQVLAGDIYSAPTNPTRLTGPAAFTVAGSTSSLGAYVAGGVFSINGTALSNGALDVNTGANAQIGSVISSGSLIANSGTGFVPSRYVLSLTVQNGTGTLTFGAYTVSTNPPSALIVENDTVAGGAIGQVWQQSVGGSNTGSFAANLAGVGSPKSSSVLPQDLAGQISLVANSTAVTGTLDLNNSGTSTSAIVPSTASTIWNAPATNGRGTASWKTADGTIYKFGYYVVSAGTVLLVDTDSNRVATGVITRQF
jgi:hypothetical protein